VLNRFDGRAPVEAELQNEYVEFTQIPVSATGFEGLRVVGAREPGMVLLGPASDETLGARIVSSHVTVRSVMIRGASWRTTFSGVVLIDCHFATISTRHTRFRDKLI
jgi:hypothetical protein